MTTGNIYFKCLCGKSLAVDVKGAGRTITCPDCGQELQIPEPVIKLKCECEATIFVPESMVGEHVQCLTCKTFWEVPGNQEDALRDHEPSEEGYAQIKLRLGTNLFTKILVVLFIIVAISVFFSLNRHKKPASSASLIDSSSEQASSAVTNKPVVASRTQAEVDVSNIISSNVTHSQAAESRIKAVDDVPDKSVVITATLAQEASKTGIVRVTKDSIGKVRAIKLIVNSCDIKLDEYSKQLATMDGQKVTVSGTFSNEGGKMYFTIQRSQQEQLSGDQLPGESKRNGSNEVESVQATAINRQEVRSQIQSKDSLQNIKPVIPSAAVQPQPKLPHAVILQAKRVQTKKDSVKKKESASLNVRHDAMNPGMTWLSNPQEVEFIYASQTVEVSVWNTGKEADSNELQVVFFVEDQETGERTVQHHHRETLELRPGSPVTKLVTSPTTRFSRVTMTVDGEKKKIGSKPYGYLVVLADAAGPFKWLGSSEVSRVLKTVDDINTAINEKKLK